MNVFNGSGLLQLRKKHGFKTPRDLCMEMYKKSGVKISGQCIKNHEEELHMPRPDTISDYANFFGVDVNFFYRKR